MTSLTSLPWRHYPLFYDITTFSTMTSLPLLLWRHYPSTMTSLPPLPWRLPWRHYPSTVTSTVTSLTPILWRHKPFASAGSEIRSARNRASWNSSAASKVSICLGRLMERKRHITEGDATYVASPCVINLAPGRSATWTVTLWWRD